MNSDQQDAVGDTDMVELQRRAFIAAGIAGVGLSGCLEDRGRSLPSPTNSWEQYMHDQKNTAATGTSVPSQGNLAWTSDAFTRWAPVAADGDVYIGNVDSTPAPKIVALEATDGGERWRVSIDEGENADEYTAAVVGELLIAAYGNHVIALDRDTGDKKWATTISGAVNSSKITAVPEASLVVVGEESSQAAGLRALDVTTGEKQWFAPLSGQRVHPPAVHDGAVYVASDSALYCLRIGDGSQRWQQRIESIALGPRPVGQELVVAAAGALAVYDADTGEQRRQLTKYEHDADGVDGVALADGTAYWLTDETLAAIAIDDGGVEWELDAEGCQQGLCVGKDAVVAPVEYDGFDLEVAWPTIAAFDRENGDVRWYYHIDGFDVMFTTPPVLVDGAVYFTANTIDAVGALGDVPEADDSGLI